MDNTYGFKCLWWCRYIIIRQKSMIIAVITKSWDASLNISPFVVGFWRFCWKLSVLYSRSPFKSRCEVHWRLSRPYLIRLQGLIKLNNLEYINNTKRLKWGGLKGNVNIKFDKEYVRSQRQFYVFVISTFLTFANFLHIVWGSSGRKETYT